VLSAVIAPPTELSGVLTDLSEIEANAGITFPQGAEDVRAHIEGFHDLSTWVRFSINPDELPSFVSHTACESPVERIPAPSITRGPNDPSWWASPAPLEALSCTVNNENMFQTIYVDDSNPAKYTVYVIAYTK